MAKNNQSNNKKGGKKKNRNQGAPVKVDVENHNPKDSKQSVLMDDV